MFDPSLLSVNQCPTTLAASGVDERDSLLPCMSPHESRCSVRRHSTRLAETSLNLMSRSHVTYHFLRVRFELESIRGRPEMRGDFIERDYIDKRNEGKHVRTALAAWRGWCGKFALPFVRPPDRQLSSPHCCNVTFQPTSELNSCCLSWVDLD